MGTPVTETKDKKLNRGCLWVVIANVILWPAVIIIVLFSQGDSEIDPERSAYTMAKTVISERLKAPSTAEFQPYDDDVVVSNGELYQVTMWVDAENSFGAMLRTTFVLQIKYDGEDYRLIYFKELPK